MKNNRLRVGIIGCGAIGSEIARACLGRLSDRIELSAVFDVEADRARAVCHDKTVRDIEELISRSDVVVEAASASVSAAILEECIENGRDCMLMSVGGLLGHEELLKKAQENDIRVYIPSGALCGIDGLKAASAGEISSVILTTRKPPKGLVGAPYLKEKRVDISSIKSETTVFEGSAVEAVKGFPQNVNVAAVLSLAGIGARRTVVRIVSSPEYTTNTHEVEIKGDFGHIITKTSNVPSRANPKTSAMAMLSAIATLEAAASSVRIGT